jgi:ribonuclease P protein component
VKRSHSLKGSKRYREVFLKGRRFKKEGVQLLVLRQSEYGDSGRAKDAAYNYDSGTKVGISISSKYGNAVERNSAKRRIRAICNELLPELIEGYYIVLKPDDNFKTISFSRARLNMRNLYMKAGILKQ